MSQELRRDVRNTSVRHHPDAQGKPSLGFRLSHDRHSSPRRIDAREKLFCDVCWRHEVQQLCPATRVTLNLSKIGRNGRMSDRLPPGALLSAHPPTTSPKTSTPTPSTGRPRTRSSWPHAPRFPHCRGWPQRQTELCLVSEIWCDQSLQT